MGRAIVVEPDAAALEEAARLPWERQVPGWLRAAGFADGVLLGLAQAGLGGVAATGLVALAGGRAGPAAFLLGAWAGFVLPGTLPRWRRRRAVAALLSNRAALAPRTWTLTPEGVAVAWRDGDLRVRWAGVEAVERGPRGLSLAWAGSVWVLPRGAFASGAEMAAVEAEIAGWRAG